MEVDHLVSVLPVHPLPVCRLEHKLDAAHPLVDAVLEGQAQGEGKEGGVHKHGGTLLRLHGVALERHLSCGACSSSNAKKEGRGGGDKVQLMVSTCGQAVALEDRKSLLVLMLVLQASQIGLAAWQHKRANEHTAAPAPTSGASAA